MPLALRWKPGEELGLVAARIGVTEEPRERVPLLLRDGKAWLSSRISMPKKTEWGKCSLFSLTAGCLMMTESRFAS